MPSTASTQTPHLTPDAHGNVFAREGCDRCSCGAKYWERDRCASCGAGFVPALAEVLTGHIASMVALLNTGANFGTNAAYGYIGGFGDVDDREWFVFLGSGHRIGHGHATGDVDGMRRLLDALSGALAILGWQAAR